MKRCSLCGRLFSAETIFCAEDGSQLVPEAPYEFGPGAMVGPYVVEELLGEGGCGAVWSGRHPKIGKRVAIKLLKISSKTSAASLARFEQEAKLVNTIENEHLINIFDFGTLPDGQPYFVMDLLKGKSLGDHLHEAGPLAIPEILEILGPVCRALYAVHKAEVVHRDLKPDNIFLTFREDAPPFPKILDFGIAKLMDSDQPLTEKTAAIFGTASYMSPEQCKSTKKVDHRTDIYALGVILYELLTKRTPFKEPEDSNGAVIAKQIYAAAEPPSTKVSVRQIPAALDAFVLKVLSKDPAERPQSAIAFFEELKKLCEPFMQERRGDFQGAAPLFLGDEPPTVKTLALQEPLPRTKPSEPSRSEDYFAGDSQEQKPLQRRRFALVGGALAALLLLGGGGYYLSTNQEKSGEPIPTISPVSDKIPAKPIEESQPTSTLAAPATAPTPKDTATEKPVTPKGGQSNTKETKSKANKQTKGEVTVPENPVVEPAPTAEPKTTPPTTSPFPKTKPPV